MPKKPELLTKKYPENYPADAVKILNAMSFTDGKSLRILGSMSLKAQQYAGDYDGYEVVELHEKTKEGALHKLATRFKQMVRHLQSLPNTYIGDIKAGSVEDWRVIDKDSFNVTESKKRIQGLLSKGVISKDEAKDALEILGQKNELLAKSKIKFHIVRWTPEEVLAGKKTLRDGSQMTLEKAFHTPTIAKMDVIGFVQNNRYTDFSVIYEFRNKDTVLNPDKVDIEKSLKENIVAYEREGNYFKAMKRRFALAKYKGDEKEVVRLTPILNSDLGRLYHVIGDIGTLESLLEDHKAPLDKIRYEIDQFKNRLANIYTLKDFLRNESHILTEIQSILHKPRDKILEPLSKLGDELEEYLQYNSKKMVTKRGGVVIPKKEFVEEHEHLIKLLEEMDSKKATKEARKQSKELKAVVRGGGVLESVLARRPDLKAQYEDTENYLFRPHVFQSLIASTMSREKYESGRKYPHKPSYEQYLKDAEERSLQRSLWDLAAERKRKDYLARLEEENNRLTEYYKQHPDEQPVACEVDENLKRITKNESLRNVVPRKVCELRHKSYTKKAQYHPIFTPLLNGVMSFGDWLTEFSLKIGVPEAQILTPLWKIARQYTDPDGYVKSEFVEELLGKVTPVIEEHIAKVEEEKKKKDEEPEEEEKNKQGGKKTGGRNRGSKFIAEYERAQYDLQRFRQLLAGISSQLDRLLARINEEDEILYNTRRIYGDDAEEVRYTVDLRNQLTHRYNDLVTQEENVTAEIEGVERYLRENKDAYEEERR